MQFYSFTLTIPLIAPFVSQLSGSKKFGLDCALLRDDNNQIVFPGTLIQGVLKENLLFFASNLEDKTLKKKIDSWFGVATADSKNNNSQDKESTYHLNTQNEDNWQPYRARLIPSQYWIAQKLQSEGSDVRYRIKIDNDKGVVEKGSYQLIENPFPSGTQINFTGTFSGWLYNEEEAGEVAHWLSKALAYTDCIGALKSIGFGRVDHQNNKFDCYPVKSLYTFSMHPDIFSPQSKLECKAEQLSFAIKIKPDRDFCFAQHQTSSNAIITNDYIPGSAIIGAIMQRINLYDKDDHPFPLIKDNINQFYFTHATPLENNKSKRRLVIPLSWVSDGKNIYDLALIKKPGLFKNILQEKTDYIAAKFQTDWKDKDWEKANKLLELSFPKRKLKIQTAIDPKTGAAEKEKLFSLETISPQNYSWISNVSIKFDTDNDIQPDKQVLFRKLSNELQTFFNYPLQHLGKTAAQSESIHLGTPVDYSHPSAVLDCDDFKVNGKQLIVITLQSDAKIFDYTEQISGLNYNSEDELFGIYANYWGEISDRGLELSHYYAQQQLVGGRYLHNRFYKDKPYNPQLITLAGSVFVLEVNQKKDWDKLKAELTMWINYGLPQIQSENNDWKTNPYLAQNGYGEITINLACHCQMKPLQNWEPMND